MIFINCDSYMKYKPACLCLHGTYMYITYVVTRLIAILCFVGQLSIGKCKQAVGLKCLIQFSYVTSAFSLHYSDIARYLLLLLDH
jgi:hypothetical protein